MSDDWVRIVPEDPEYVPDQVKQQQALAYLRTIAPAADEIAASVEDRIVFYDCGSNFERVSCPSGGTQLDPDEGGEWMDADHDGTGFTLATRAMKCCGARHTLHELRYELPQGFGRFELGGMNPGFSRSSAERCLRFEALLGGKVRVIYRHL
jgi:hypothetical protein